MRRIPPRKREEFTPPPKNGVAFTLTPSLTPKGGAILSEPAIRIHIGGRYYKAMGVRFAIFDDLTLDLLAPYNYWHYDSQRIHIDLLNRPYVSTFMAPYGVRRSDEYIEVLLSKLPTPIYRKFKVLGDQEWTFAAPVIPSFPPSFLWLDNAGPNPPEGGELFLPIVAYGGMAFRSYNNTLPYTIGAQDGTLVNGSLGTFSISELTSTWPATWVRRNLSGAIEGESPTNIPVAEIKISFTPSSAIGQTMYTYDVGRGLRQGVNLYPVIGLNVFSVWSSTPIQDGYGDWHYTTNISMAIGVLAKHGLVQTSDGQPLPQIVYTTYTDEDGNTYTNHSAPLITYDHKEPFWAFWPLYSNYKPSIYPTTTDVYENNLPPDYADGYVIPYNAIATNIGIDASVNYVSSSPPSSTWASFTHRGYSQVKVISGTPSNGQSYLDPNTTYYKVFPRGGNSFGDANETRVDGGARLDIPQEPQKIANDLYTFYRLDKISAIRMVVPPFYTPLGLINHLSTYYGLPPYIMDMDALCPVIAAQPLYSGRYGTIPCPYCSGSGSLLGIPIQSSANDLFSADVALLDYAKRDISTSGYPLLAPQHVVAIPVGVDKLAVATVVRKSDTDSGLMVSIANRCLGKDGNFRNCDADSIVELPLLTWLSTNEALRFPQGVQMDSCLPVQGLQLLHAKWPLPRGVVFLDPDPNETTMSFDELARASIIPSYCFAGTPRILSISFVPVDNEGVAYELGLRAGLSQPIWAYPISVDLFDMGV